MALLSLDDLIATETRQDVEDEILQVGETMGLPARAWQAVGVARTTIASVSQKISDVLSLVKEITKGAFLDLGSADWQALKAKEDFGVDKIFALPATGAVTLVNPGATVYTLAIGDLIVANTATGKTYRNTVAGTLSGASTLTDLGVSADEVGTSSNSGPGTITTIVSPAMPGVTVTNAASVLGSDDETKAQLAARCRQKLSSLSPNGPDDAYAYVARTTPGLTAPITRTNIVLDPTTGIVALYIANANGSPPPGDVAIVDANIQTKAVPATVTETTYGATNVVVDVTAQVWVKNLSTSVAQAQATISAGISAYLATLDVGGLLIPGATQGYVYVEELEGAIRGSYPGIVRVSVSGANVAVGANEVAILGAATITVTS